MGTHPIFESDFDCLTEQPCLCFGVKIAGGLDQDAQQNPFKPGDSGIFVSSIEPDSLADKYGLKIGDKILQANGYDFTMVTLKQAERRIQRKQILRLKITRDDLSAPKMWGHSN